MKRLQAFQFELMPDGEQQHDRRRFAGVRRFVYNKALALQKADLGFCQNYAAGAKFISYVDMATRLPEWKKEFPWLRESPSHTLQQSLKDSERAFKNFFEKRADFPRFKRKGTGDSFRYPDSKQFEIDQGNSRIKFPKLGQIRYRNSRDILGTAKNITVSQTGGTWFASIQTERDVEQPIPTATSAVGIDREIVRFATLSDGSFTKFECVDCGHEENADVVGAMNLLARGDRVAACGEDGSGLARKRKTKPASVKQEPT